MKDFHPLLLKLIPQHGTPDVPETDYCVKALIKYSKKIITRDKYANSLKQLTLGENVDSNTEMNFFTPQPYYICVRSYDCRYINEQGAKRKLRERYIKVSYALKYASTSGAGKQVLKSVHGRLNGPEIAEKLSHVSITADTHRKTRTKNQLPVRVNRC